MAKSDNNAIKDFIKSQTTPVRIGVPASPQVPHEHQPISQSVSIHRETVGRPKSEILKTKLSLYVPVEDKEKLVRIQHAKMFSSLNDVMMIAISEYIRRNEI